MVSFRILLLLGALSYSCESYKILAVFPVPAYSHYVLASRLVKELANRDHEVTFVTPYLQKTTIKNLKEISVADLIKVIEELKTHFYGLNKLTILRSAVQLTHLGYVITEKLLENENVQKLLHSDAQFDVVILPQFMTEGLLGIAHHFKAPLVLASSMPLFSWANFLLSHPSPSSYVPNILTEYTGHMNFWQRVANSFHDTINIIYHQWVMLPKHRELVKKYIPGQPDLYNFLNNASILLINSHVSITEAIPQVPNAVEIGGFHVEEPKELPKDLKKYLDESENGVVVFSLGSNLKSSDLPQSTRDGILKAFSKLKQNVLWKWETDNLPGQPKNVKLMKWLPQSDVLAHPNVRALISHGGLISTIESIYRGIPIVGIPVFTDQKMNMATAVSCGYGVVIPFQELSEEKLTSALQQVLNDPKYSNNAKRRSKIMRDRPIQPLDSAVYWIEYVVRHQGAPHLRYAGMDLTWYQRNLLDVIAFTVVVILITIFAISTTFKQILKKIRRGHDKNKKIN